MRVRSIGPNQTQIDTGTWSILVSYQTPVAAFDCVNGGWYRTEKFHSKTTSKHINKWIEGTPNDRPQSFFDNLLEK